MKEQSSLRYAWYVLGILLLAYISSFIDRQILALLVKPIKESFGISDTQMGLLMGLSFALFYTFLGIPIGIMADRMSRKKIIGWGIEPVFAGVEGFNATLEAFSRRRATILPR